MSLSVLASLGSFVSGVAVLISLIYLARQVRQAALQVRQTERNQQASIRHSRISRAVEIFLAQADPRLADAGLHATQNPEAVTQTEISQFLSLSRAMFFHFEDSFYQHQEGLLNEAAFSTVVAGSRAMGRSPGHRLAWKTLRTGFAGPFVDFMDGLVVQALPERPTPLPSVEEWKAALAAEMTTTSR